MSRQKTKPQGGQESVTNFINAIASEEKRQDAIQLLDLMSRVTGQEPKLWGNSMIGFGSYHYKYESGREGEWFLAGFSLRKANLSIYVVSGFDTMGDLLEKLGKHKRSVGCLYIKKLHDIDMQVLEEITVRSVEIVKKRYAKYN
ncbi:MAG: DUF1801 domain-containing protein [Ekhidna sp.]|nr:DUF1801 domain-containing protein [Ekhidna sp.]